MKTATDPTVSMVQLRSSLKTLVANEMQQLPAYLEGLPPKEKLDYILKLMPYVFPKVDSVFYKKDETGTSWIDSN